MLTMEKWMLQLNRMFTNFLVHLIFWYLMFLFYIFLTGDDHLFTNRFNFMYLRKLPVMLLLFSGAIALWFAFLDTFFSLPFIRWISRWLIILFRLFLYLFTGLVLLMLATEAFIQVNKLNSHRLLDNLQVINSSLIRFLVFFYFSVFLIRLLSNMMARIGKGNMKRWMLGMLDKPMEQERIFMFIDMKSSTFLAEKLDHKKFSHLIRDVFNDLQVVDNYQGEVYQYLGDGAVISWDLKSGVYRNNCLRAFYAFQKTIRRRRRYYRWRYGQEPEFKAGAHAGKVMVLQVGQIRRDISYNGDTINTAARIESKCNEYKQELLISGALYELLGNRKGFTFRNAGNIKLDGKKQGVDIYKVKKGNKKEKRST
jgi:adenylate cyclase